jgi:eukaryotic-like serine/threonine-protein kinase
MPDPPVAADPPEPIRLEVLGEIASGGMGRVELGRILPGGELIALKRLHPHLARDQEFVQMFLDEAWMTAAARHPNVVELLGVGSDAEGMFLAMELVDGAALGALATAGRQHQDPLPEALIAFVGRQVARGLGSVHGLCDARGRPLGLVHRDLSPSNVLVGFDGAVKISDFGVAKAVGRYSRTATDVLKGKVAFMSPEYARRRQADGRSDLYALGVTLFALATGRLPFDAPSDVELLKRVIGTPAPAMTELVPALDRELSELVARLLRKDPAKRPQQAGDVEHALDRWLRARNLQPDQLAEDLGRYAARHAQSRRLRLAELGAQPTTTRAAAGREPDTGDPADGPEAPTLRLGPPREVSERLALRQGAVVQRAAHGERGASTGRPAPGERGASTGRPAPGERGASTGRPAPGERGPTRVVRRDAQPPLTSEPPPIASAPTSATPSPAAGPHHAVRSSWPAAAVAAVTVCVVAASLLALEAGAGRSQSLAPLARWMGRLAHATAAHEPAAGPEPAPAPGAGGAAAEPEGSSTPEASAPPSGGRAPPPPAATRGHPRRSCTPADFDYPSCLPRHK